VTGSRADWGLLYPLAKHIWQSDDTLQLLVTGSHLSPTHGYTVDQISIPVSGEIECVLSADTKTGVCKGVSLAVSGFSDAFDALEPDCVIVLGDRWEILAASIAAHIHRIPISHLHGGEITAGATDEAWRHSITKMSSLHFTATETYRNRVIQLGEHPDTVFNVGALGTQGLICRDKQPNNGKVVVLYHPETLHPNSITDFWNIIEVLKELDLKPTLIMSNADNGGHNINRIIEQQGYGNLWEVFTSKHRDDFLSLLMGSDAIIGNSSAGIIEAPALGVPTINVGNRQKGREMASSILNVETATIDNIKDAFGILYSDLFQDGLFNIYAPYGKGENVAGKIFDIIKKEIGNINLMKGFYDVSFTA